MANVSYQLKISSASSQAQTGLPGQVTAGSIVQTMNTSMPTSGTAADQVDLKYTNTLSFTGTTPQTIDLTSLTDIYGGAVNFARVKTITLNIKATTDGQTLTMAPGASNGWTGWMGAGSSLVFQAATVNNPAGLTLTAPNITAFVVGSTSKTITFTPSATMTVDIEITGCHV